MNLPFNIICIDIETTGSDSKLASIVQLAAVIVDTEFKTIRGLEFNSYVKPLDNFRDPSAMNIHCINEQILKTAPSLKEVLDMFENFCSPNKILASWGNYFDINFLFRQYEKLYRTNPFHHRSIDLKSIAIWERAKEDVAIRGGIKKFLSSIDEDFEGTPHNALDDIKNTIRLLQLLKGRRQ